MADPMTPDEANNVLMVASAYDARKPSELSAGLWAADLNDAGVSATDAAQAVRQHYRDRPDTYVKPGHVIAIAREAARARADQEATRLALAGPRPGVIPAEEGARRVQQMLAEHRARKAAAAHAAECSEDADSRRVSPEDCL